MTFNETPGNEASSEMIFMQYFISYSLVEILLSHFPVEGTGLWGSYTISHVSQLAKHGAEINTEVVWVSFTYFIRKYVFTGKVLSLGLSCELLACYHRVKLCSFSLIFSPHSPLSTAFIITVPKYPAGAASRLRALFLLLLSRNTTYCGRGGPVAKVALVQGTEAGNGV